MIDEKRPVGRPISELTLQYADAVASSDFNKPVEIPVPKQVEPNAFRNRVFGSMKRYIESQWDIPKDQTLRSSIDADGDCVFLWMGSPTRR